MPFNTKLTQALGIKVPVVQGGMQWVGYAELASAVSNAGGLGIVSFFLFSSVSPVHRPISLENVADIARARGTRPQLTALTQPTPADLTKEIARCKTMTSAPFAVNLTLLPALVPPDYHGT